MADRNRGDPFEQEDDRFDMRRLGRAALWALAAALAVITLGAAAQSETGARRMVTALASLPAAWRPVIRSPPGHDPQPVHGVAAEPEARRLADTFRLLSADRDRLAARVDALERHLDLTGAIPAQPAAGHAMQVRGNSAAHEPQTADESGHAAAHDAAATSTAARADFGIDLGGDGTIDGLRALWATLLAQHGTTLEGLRPRLAVREASAGAIELRLIAGPLASAAAAAQLCASLASSHASCHPTTFDGQQLALR